MTEIDSSGDLQNNVVYVIFGIGNCSTWAYVFQPGCVIEKFVLIVSVQNSRIDIAIILAHSSLYSELL